MSDVPRTPSAAPPRSAPEQLDALYAEQRDQVRAQLPDTAAAWDELAALLAGETGLTTWSHNVRRGGPFAESRAREWRLELALGALEVLAHELVAGGNAGAVKYLPDADMGKRGAVIGMLTRAVALVEQQPALFCSDDKLRDHVAAVMKDHKALALLKTMRGEVLSLSAGQDVDRKRARAEPHSDGPREGRWVHWGGKKHEVSEPLTYRLIAHMWDREHATYDDLMGGAVWDAAVEPQTVRSRVNRVNNALAKIGVAWVLAADSESRAVLKVPRD